MERVCFISFHACPLAAPGQGKSGGMNVHVRELASALGNLGIPVDIFTRSHCGEERVVEQISPEVRVIHLPGGPTDAPLANAFDHLPQFLQALQDFQTANNLE